tara:strand:+ start:115 stop:528 length:414 start_codon:yes stop_codon:yes gene_type:complete
MLAGCSKKEEQKGIDASRISAGPKGRWYLDGKPWNGPHKEYFADGQVKVEGELVDGRKNGRWVFYRANGSVESEYFFKLDVLDGNETHRHDDEYNRRNLVKVWKNGRLVSRHEWDISGKRIQTAAPKDSNPMVTAQP